MFLGRALIAHFFFGNCPLFLGWVGAHRPLFNQKSPHDSIKFLTFSGGRIPGPPIFVYFHLAKHQINSFPFIFILVSDHIFGGIAHFLWCSGRLSPQKYRPRIISVGASYTWVFTVTVQLSGKNENTGKYRQSTVQSNCFQLFFVKTNCVSSSSK